MKKLMVSILAIIILVITSMSVMAENYTAYDKMTETEKAVHGAFAMYRLQMLDVVMTFNNNEVYINGTIWHNMASDLKRDVIVLIYRSFKDCGSSRVIIYDNHTGKKIASKVF